MTTHSEGHYEPRRTSKAMQALDVSGLTTTTTTRPGKKLVFGGFQGPISCLTEKNTKFCLQKTLC